MQDSGSASAVRGGRPITRGESPAGTRAAGAHDAAAPPRVAPVPSLREWLGARVGELLAPAVQVVNARAATARGPRGIVYRADVEPLAPAGVALASLAARLTGVALVRFSAAVWPEAREWPDLLGCAVRFRGDGPVSEVSSDGDQDVLFTSSPSLAAAVLAPLRADVHDYLDNVYYALTPFDVAGVGRASLRLAAPRVALIGRDRAARLEYAVQQGAAALRLELRTERGPGAGRWRPVAMVRLRARVELDQRALELSPCRTARGVVPRGFVHAVRAAVREASQRGRAW